MNQKTFLTLSRQESTEQYRLLLLNSDRNWAVCESLISQDQYDLGASMAIISTEELIKSMVVFLNTMGFEFGRSKEMERFFRDHSIRFLVALGLFILSDLGKDLLKIIKYIANNPASIEKWKNEMRNIDEFLDRDLKPYFEKKKERYRDEFEWFSSLEALRQEGFYYDYKIDKGPSFSQEERWKDVYEKLKQVRSVGKGIITSYEDNSENINQIQLIAQEWEQKNYYKHLDQMLQLLRKTSRSPFDAIRKKISIT